MDMQGKDMHKEMGGAEVATDSPPRQIAIVDLEHDAVAPAPKGLPGSPGYFRYWINEDIKKLQARKQQLENDLDTCKVIMSAL